MKTFNKQAASLKKNLKQNNLMPLFVVFSVIVMLSLTYKSVSKVNGVGNTMFKEGNRNRRRRVRQGFREGNIDGDDDGDDDDPDDDAVREAEIQAFMNKEGIRNRRRRVRQGFREGTVEKKNDPLLAATDATATGAIGQETDIPEGFLSGAKYQGFTSSRGRVRRARGRK